MTLAGTPPERGRDAFRSDPNRSCSRTRAFGSMGADFSAARRSRLSASLPPRATASARPCHTCAASGCRTAARRNHAMESLNRRVLSRRRATWKLASACSGLSATTPRNSVRASRSFRSESSLTPASYVKVRSAISGREGGMRRFRELAAKLCPSPPDVEKRLATPTGEPNRHWPDQSERREPGSFSTSWQRPCPANAGWRCSSGIPAPEIP